MATSAIFFWFYFYFWRFSLSIHKNDIMMSRHPKIRACSTNTTLLWTRCAKNLRKKIFVENLHAAYTYPLLIKCFDHHKFDDFQNLIQLFPMTPYSILIEMNDVNNVIYNNFEYHDQLPKMQCFLSRNF